MFAESRNGCNARLVFWDSDLFGLQCSLAFSLCSRLVATGGHYGRVQLWNPQTLETRELRPQYSTAVECLAFSPDGSLLATSSLNSATLRTWELPTARLRNNFRLNTGIYALCFTQDGRTLLAGCSDGTIRRWDTGTGEPLATLRGHAVVVYSLAISPDGTTLASGAGDRKILLWDLRTGRVNKTLIGHTNDVHWLVISPDGRTLASGSRDRKVKLWNVSSGHELLNLAHAHEIVGIQFSPDGQTMITWDKDAEGRVYSYLWTAGVRWRVADVQSGCKGMTVYETHSGARVGERLGAAPQTPRQ